MIFTTRSCVRQRYPFPPLLFNLPIEMLIEFVLLSYKSSGIDICSDRTVWLVVYGRHCAAEWKPKLRVFLNRLNDSGCMFGICFTLSKCQMMLQLLESCSWTEQLGEMGRFSYLGSCVLSVIWYSYGKWSVFTHVLDWRLPIWGICGVKGTLSYQRPDVCSGSEVGIAVLLRNMAAECRCWKPVFEHRYLQSNGRIWLENCVNNSEVRSKVLVPRVQPSE